MKKPRHSNQEKKGLLAVETVVSNEWDWPFRRIIEEDFGIDAHIEVKQNGDPKCKLIGVQIKTGKSHVYIGKERITYNTSLVHYNYWIGANIPVLFIVHIPEENKTYWQFICESNFKKNKRSWTLNIPLTNIFDKDSKEKIQSVIRQGNRRHHKLSPVLDHEKSWEEIFSRRTICMNNALDRFNYLNDIKEKFNEQWESFNSSLRVKIDSNEYPNDFEGIMLIKDFQLTTNVFAIRLENELDLYTKLLIEAILAERELIEKYPNDLDKKSIAVLSEVIENALSLTDELIISTNEWLNFISDGFNTGISSIESGSINLRSIAKYEINEYEEINSFLSSHYDFLQKVKESFN